MKLKPRTAITLDTVCLIANLVSLGIVLVGLAKHPDLRWLGYTLVVVFAFCIMTGGLRIYFNRQKIKAIGGII
jgi:hypothetical protein